MKKLRLGILALLLIAVIVSFVKSDAASTVSVYSLPKVMQSVNATGTGTSLSVQFPLAPPVGDTIVCTESDSYPGTVSAPSGYTLLGTTSTSSNSVSEAVYYHTVASGDSNSTHTFSITSSATWLLNCDDWHGTNATVPVESTVGTANSAAVTSLTTTPALIPNEPGIVGVEAIARNTSTISATDGSFPQSVWSVTETGLSAQELDMSSAWNPFTSSLVGSPKFTSSADSVALVYVMRPLVGNFAEGGRVVAAATATPPPGGSGSIAPMINRIAWWGYPSGDSNKHISPGNAHKWLQNCVGIGTTTSVSGGDTGGANIVNDCTGSFAYVEIGMLQPTTSGTIVTDPWLSNYSDGSAGGGSGTCPAAFKNGSKFMTATGTDAPNFTSTSDTINWGVYANGTTIGTPSGQITGFQTGGSNYYRLFTNFGSTTMLQAVNDFIHDCSYNRSASGTVTQAVNLYTGFFHDNLHSGLQAQAAALWAAGSGGYEQGVNWSNGTVIPSPWPSACTGGAACYGSVNCNGGPSNGTTFWNGSALSGACAQKAYINTNSSASTATYPADSGGTSSLLSTEKSFLGSLTHTDGTKYSIIFNGMWNDYDACQFANAASNVTYGTVEFAILGVNENGVPNADALNAQHYNVAAADYACGGKTKYALLDDFNSSAYNGGAAGTAAPGTAAYEMQVRLHYGALLTMETPDSNPNMMASWPAACNNSCPYNTWTDTFAFHFTGVSGRITPYPAMPLGSGGAYCGEYSVYHYFFTGVQCTQGGVYDDNVARNASDGNACSSNPNCAIVAAFQNYYVWNTSVCGKNYDQSLWVAGGSCVKNVGPVVSIWNLSGSAITLNTTWLTNAFGSTVESALKYIVTPGCVPSTGLIGTSGGSPMYPNDGITGTPTTTVECSSGTYADVYNGSQMGFTSLAPSFGTTIPDEDAVILSAGTP